MGKPKLNILALLIRLLGIIGFGLVFGSIVSFIVMDVALEKLPSIQGIYWLRFFVGKIIAMATIPGVWLMFMGCLCSIWLQPEGGKRNSIIITILAGLITLNAQFIIAPIAEQIDAISIEQLTSKQPNPTYSGLKKTEDMLGAANFIMLLFIVLFTCFTPFKPNIPSSISGQTN